MFGMGRKTGREARKPSLSLRSKLGLAAGAGLLTTAAVTALLFFTAGSAEDVVIKAHIAHDRVRVFSGLLDAAVTYQRTSYSAARELDDNSVRDFLRAGTAFQQVIDEASLLPAQTLREQELRTRVAAQSRTVLDHFRDSEKLFAQVEGIRERQGSRAALREVNRLLGPIEELKATLDAEIARNDKVLAAAVSRTQMLNRTVAIAAIVTLLISSAFLMMILRLLSTRLRPGLARLEAGAQAISAGDLDHRIGLAGSDELSSLALAFDSMADTITEKRDALHEIQLGLEQAVAERTRELERANAQLSLASERRKAFLADVSHELRTPITVIRGEAQVAIRMFGSAAFDPQEVFEHILNQTEDMSRLVNDLFLIAHAEAGGLPLDRRYFDLGEIAAKLASDFETLAIENGGSIVTHCEDGVTVHADEDRLRRAMAAVIDNAIRHSQPGVNIEVHVTADRDEALITVCDDGPGIDPRDADRLFERFSRGQTRGEGSGLGLSIVSALIEAHGGSASLEACPSPARGTKVVMRLPRVTTGRAAA